jgi:hypothetical protein
MFQPKKPDFKGQIQVKTGTNYTSKGEIALWKHNEAKMYVLRGYITMDGQRYHVSLSNNGDT